MAEQEPVTGGNGSGEAGTEPAISILAQYIKDLSVENPSAPQVFQWQAQPNLDVLSGEVKTVLDLLAQLHEQTLALVEALSEMNERTYEPALEFLRDMQTRVRGGPAKK